MTRVRWLLIFWLFVMSCVAFLDRVNISIAAVDIAETYHLTHVHLGWIFSAFLVGYAVFQTPAGWLADRLGPRRVLTAAVVWWGIFTALTASVPPRISFALGLFIAIRFLFGAGEAIMYPAANQFTSRWIPTEERGLANGWIFAGVGVGSAITPPLVSWVMVRHGWRASFWICSLLGVAAGGIWYLISRDTPEEHPSVSSEELKKIQSGLTRSRAPANGRSAKITWREILGSRNIWIVTLCYFCFGYVSWIFFSWFYTYLAKVRGLNLKSSALYTMVPFLAMAACCALGGLASDHIARWKGKRLGRCGVAVVSMALAAAFLVVGARAESAQFASIILAGGAGALYLSQSSFWAVAADIAGNSSGSVSGFMNMGAQFGGAVTASLTPWIADHYGWKASFFTAAAMCTFGAVAWLLVDPNRRLTSAD